MDRCPADTHQCTGHDSLGQTSHQPRPSSRQGKLVRGSHHSRISYPQTKLSLVYDFLGRGCCSLRHLFPSCNSLYIDTSFFLQSVVILDLGSCSVRAGVLGAQPSLPSLFFPTAVAIDDAKGKDYVGIPAFTPDVRANCRVTLPVRPSVKVDKVSLSGNSRVLEFLTFS